MKQKRQLVTAHVTLDKERYLSCPAIQKGLALCMLGLRREIPFEQLAGMEIRIAIPPLPPNHGQYASDCELTHWEVFIDDARPLGHRNAPWVCPHQIDLPD